jgi:trehalose 6-phosphate phosphatase
LKRARLAGVTASPLTDIGPLRPLLSKRPLGLFSDIDGTLAPVVPRPEDARVTPRCRGLLKGLMERGVRVALITGRSLETARTMAGLGGVAYGASHGLELWIDGRAESTGDAREYPRLIERVLAEAGDLEGAGVLVERKGTGVAFHYRRAGSSETARAAISRAIGSPTAVERFVVLEGRKVFELRPKIDVNKGTAARVLASRLGVKSVLSLGDDRTDIDMFHAVSALSREGLAEASVAVLSPEVPPDVLEAADYSVDGVAGVEWLLGEVLTAAGGTSPGGPGTGARARS